MNQRSDFVEAKHKCKKLQDKQRGITGEGNKPIPFAQQVRKRLDQHLEASKNTITDLNLVPDGDSTLPPGRRIHLRQRTGQKAATGSQIEAGVRGKHHPGLNSNFFFVQTCHFACRKFYLLAIDGGVDRHTYRAPHFLMHSCCAVSLSSCCQSVQSHIDLHAPAWLKSRSASLCRTFKHFILIAPCPTPCRP